MSDWTKRDQARVDFLNAAVAFGRKWDEDPDAFLIPSDKGSELHQRWVTYRDLIDGNEENATLDPIRWFCPHCGAQRPQFNFHLVETMAIGVGALRYFNVSCGNEQCRKLLSVSIIGYIDEATLAAGAQANMNRHRA